MRLQGSQEDLLGMLRTLAQQVENLPLVMDVEDMKRKAARFQEALDRDKGVLDSLIP